MATILGWLDMSAHARGGHGYSSHSHVSGWEILSAIAFIILVTVAYQAAKFSFSEAGFFVGILVLAAIAGLLIACVFVGPILVVVGIALCIAAYIWTLTHWFERQF
jgi:hypothetical protein